MTELMNKQTTDYICPSCRPKREAEQIDTDTKVTQAVKLIKSATSMHNYTIAFSGGKDSMITRFLTIEAGQHLPLVYNSTTIDPPGTIPFCEHQGAQVNRPKKTFLQLVEQKGMPNQFRRFCCAILKEQYISDYLMIGVRSDESVKRKIRYKEPEMCFIYSKRKHIETYRLFPLLNFNNDDIDYLVQKHSIEMHPKYYDESGKFIVTRRLGCIGCPLKADRGRSDFLQYPKLLRQIIKRLVSFHTRLGRTPTDAYLNAVYTIFYSNHKYDKFMQTYHGLFSNDPKAFLEQYFKIQLP